MKNAVKWISRTTHLTTVVLHILRISNESPSFTGTDDDVTGYYRVRAIDYWNTRGPLTPPKYYPTWTMHH